MVQKTPRFYVVYTGSTLPLSPLPASTAIMGDSISSFYILYFFSLCVSGRGFVYIRLQGTGVEAKGKYSKKCGLL
jgi:hypothetical protein